MEYIRSLFCNTDPFTEKNSLGFTLIITLDAEKHEPVFKTSYTKTTFDNFQSLKQYFYQLEKINIESNDFYLYEFESNDKSIDITPFLPWLNENSIQIKE